MGQKHWKVMCIYSANLYYNWYQIWKMESYVINIVNCDLATSVIFILQICIITGIKYGKWKVM